MRPYGVQRSLLIGALALLALVGTTSRLHSQVGSGEVTADPKPLPGQSSQGWQRHEQLLWYHADQGSRLVPESWLTALEVKDGTARFFTPAHLVELGYLPSDSDDTTHLPIGFSRNTADDRGLTYTRLQWFKGQDHRQPWIGMTCAACHTGEVRGSGGPIRIDGGPGMGDFQSLIEQLDEALGATLADPAKFERFAMAVLGDGSAPDAANRTLLRTALATLVAWEGQVRDRNDPAEPGRTTLRYGFGRLDAFGHIFNKAALLAGTEPPFAAAADAPVSYPFLWNIVQHDKLQWNGIAPNHALHLPGGQFDIGAIGRNTGEMIGVFGDVAVPARYSGIDGYRSSANVSNLDGIEVQLARLKPPAWPATFGAIDQAQWRAGRDLYSGRCQGCHQVVTDLKTPIKAAMTPIWGGPGAVGTDPWMACNAFSYRAGTGRLLGTPDGYLTGAALAHVADDRTMLTTMVSGVLTAKKAALVRQAGRAFFGLPRVITAKPNALAPPELAQRAPAVRLAACRAQATDPLMAYKGRPLDGIWATAPYLHNGSVASLYELLLPPAERLQRFEVGGRTLDPVKVGFVAAPHERTFTFATVDAAGRPIPGNSNAGHDYGNASLSDPERYALIAYLKSL